MIDRITNLLVLVIVVSCLAGCWMGEKRVMAKPRIHRGDSNSPFIMRDFAAKALYTEVEDRKWYQMPSDNLPASVQWHATLTNETGKAAGCALDIKLLDEDNFLLGEITYRSSGDVIPKMSTPISGDISLKLGVVRHLKLIKVIAIALPSQAEEAAIAAEKEKTLRAIAAENEKIFRDIEAANLIETNKRAIEREKNEEALRLTQSIAKARDDAALRIAWREEKAKWDLLEVGMSKSQVMNILGRPQTLNPYEWSYGFQKTVRFHVVKGYLEGWQY